MSFLKVSLLKLRIILNRGVDSREGLRCKAKKDAPISHASTAGGDKMPGYPVFFFVAFFFGLADFSASHCSA